MNSKYRWEINTCNTFSLCVITYINNHIQTFTWMLLHYSNIFTLLSHLSWGDWRDRSAENSTGYCSRRHRLNSQHHDSSQLSVMSLQGEPVPSSGLHAYQVCKWFTDKHPCITLNAKKYKVKRKLRISQYEQKPLFLWLLFLHFSEEYTIVYSYFSHFSHVW